MAARTMEEHRQNVDGAFYRENGYYIYPGALSPEEVEELRQDTVKVCRWAYGPIEGDTAPEAHESEEDILARHLCVHFPHKCSPVMQRYLGHPAIAGALTEFIGPNVKCMQSMLFVKSSGMPGQAWHQDEDYIPTRDRSLTGAWIALDDATIENGCLWVIPGSHRRGILWPQQVQQDKRFDCSAESYNFPYSEKDEVPVEVEAGALVFFNGYLLHRSMPNNAQAGYRRVLVNHYMSAESLLPWIHDPEGPQMALQDTRDFEIIAGVDPYPWLEKHDIFQPALRKSGKGGCFHEGGKEVTEAASAS